MRFINEPTHANEIKPNQGESSWNFLERSREYSPQDREQCQHLPSPSETSRTQPGLSEARSFFAHQPSTLPLSTNSSHLKLTRVCFFCQRPPALIHQLSRYQTNSVTISHHWWHPPSRQPAAPKLIAVAGQRNAIVCGPLWLFLPIHDQVSAAI